MFQYGAARRLAYIHQTKLFIDVTGFASYTLRKYELDVFKINAEIATPDLLRCVSVTRKDEVRSRIRHLFLGEPIIQVVRVYTPDFHESILSLPDNVYLDGYWQSEKYFHDIVDFLRNEFSFVISPSIINQEMMDKIKKCNSVSLHIRRGDYISNSETMKFHGVLGTEYYRVSLNLIKEKIKDPEIFVFSDDIMWAKANLDTDLPIHFIDHNGTGKDYEDLRLMSNCQHHIIANSSFSWWGAWLSANPDKIVIAPKQWFNDQSIDSKDLIPNEWVKQ